MIEVLLAKLRARDDISPEEEAALRACVVETRRFPADQTVVKPDVELTFSTLLLAGFMCRFRDMSDGARQITELHAPGDFADLHSLTLKRLDHGVLSLTPVTIGVAPHDRLRKITEDHPHLTRVLWFSTNLDAAIHREWAVSLGRRSALSRRACSKLSPQPRRRRSICRWRR